MPPVHLRSQPVLVPVNPHLSPTHAHVVTGALSDGPLRPNRRQPRWAPGFWEDASRLLGDHNLGSFTVITSDSGGVSADIHDRMPVWLATDHAKERMTAAPDDAMAMLLASETPVMKAYRVSLAVNTPRNNATTPNGSCSRWLEPGSDDGQRAVRTVERSSPPHKAKFFDGHRKRVT